MPASVQSLSSPPSKPLQSKPPQTPDEQKPSNTVNLAAGAFSGAVAAFVTQPLDFLKVALQTQPGQLGSKEIIALCQKAFFTRKAFAGATPNIANLTGLRALKFVVQPWTERQLQGTPLASHPYLIGLTSGFVAGCAQGPCAVPLSVVKVQQQTMQRQGVFATAEHLYKTRGLGGFSVGFWSTTAVKSVWNAVFFGTVAVTKDLLTAMDSENPMPAAQKASIAGGIAGAAACFANVPFDVVMARQQSALDRTSMLKLMAHIIKTEGPRALYKGLYIKALYYALTGAINLPLFEAFQKWFTRFRAAS